MIIEVTGDILLSSAHAIAHGVSPNDPFHSGLALSLREKWPSMYKDFRHYGQTTHPHQGTIWAWAGAGEGPHGSVRIIALLTQEGGFEHGSRPGPASLSAINHALKDLRLFIERENIRSLALPRLCSGVGGMDFDHVLPLIRQHLGNLGIPVYLYSTYHKGLQAAESAPALAAAQR